MRYETVKDAAYAWVESFNAFPQWIVERIDGDYLTEITLPSVGDRVYVFEDGEYGEITDIIRDENKTEYEIELDNDKIVTVSDGDFENSDENEFLPMWGTMWEFSDIADYDWVHNEYGLFEVSGLQALSDCGFRVYEYEDRDGNYLLLFRIDGAGYDFYDRHWIPLYKARGLRWHKEEEMVKK